MLKLEIFFSYAREDALVVRQVASALRDPIVPWIDERDLPTGSWFPDRIRRAISEECAFVALFLSVASIHSEWVVRETAWALERESWMRRSTRPDRDPFIPFVLPIALPPLTNSDVPRSLHAHNIYFPNERIALESQIAERVERDLFTYAAAAFAGRRPTRTAATAEVIESELRQFMDYAYRVVARMRDSVDALASDRMLESQLIEAILDYNRFATPLMSRLPTYVVEVRDAWGNTLGDEFEGLARFVEERVFRRQVYSLNEVTKMTNALQDTPASDRSAVAQMNATKDEQLKAVARALSSLNQRVGRLTTKIRHETFRGA